MFNRAIFKGFEKSGDAVRAVVVYLSEEGGEEVRTYIAGDQITSQWLQATARREVAALNAVAQAKQDIEPGEIDLAPEQAKQQTLRELFYKKVSRLQTLKKALDLGLPVEAEHEAAAADLKKDFEISFVDFL